ncbi:MAG: DNA-processing protein DprA [Thermoleophilaceae bacterium]
MIAACAPCLRRAHLLGHLAGSIAGLLDRPGRRAAGLLALPEEQLLAAVVGERSGAARAFLEAFDPDAARGWLRSRSLGAVCRHADAYPAVLQALSDPPAVLFLAGRAAALAPGALGSAVALVGTRNASPYGLEIAYELGRGLGAAGVTVVSGLALGIDAAAHRGCLDAGGSAVAVLAGGADVPYPRTNRRVYERIRATGAVVSELPPGQRAYRWAFPARNRIMAGLAQVTVVVEAADPSGSLITSVFAADLGRTVAAVPGRATSRFSAGSNRLLKDGALMVTSVGDLLDELFGPGAGPPRAPAAGPPPWRAAPELAVVNGDRPGVGGEPLAPGSDRSADGSRGRAVGSRGQLDPVEQDALDAVEAGLGVDGVSACAGLPAREVRALLTRLEASGHLRRDGLGGYLRTGAVP